MDHFILALAESFAPISLLYLMLGSFVGIVFAAVPGITIFMAVVLILPFTYTMTPSQGIATMVGVVVGGMSGGLISSILLGIPGGPADIATLFDGHPMARKGKPGLALGLGIMASFYGGLLAVGMLIFLAPPIIGLGLMFGPWETFALMIFALSILASLGGESITKSLLAGMIGLFISAIGTDPIQGTLRLTFGYEDLAGGFGLLPAVVGLYAFPSMIIDIQDDIRRLASGVRSTPVVQSRGPLPKAEYLEATRIIFRDKINLIRSSVVGCLIGALPGAGASTGAFLAYDQAKKFSKNPEEFGTGTPSGIIASEAGNNADSPGSLITTLGLGIPGDANGAVMLGAMMIHGITPGPLLYQQQPVLVYAVLISLLLAHPMFLLLHLIGLRFFIRAAMTPKHYLFPAVIVFCAIGAFCSNYRLFDLWVFLGFGIVGLAFTKWEIPLEPIVLGLVLGTMAEISFRRALMTNPDPSLFVSRPISATLLLIALVSLCYSMWQVRCAAAKRAPASGS